MTLGMVQKQLQKSDTGLLLCLTSLPIVVPCASELKGPG